MAKADAKDPAYETLNGMGNEVFGEGGEEDPKKKTANMQQQAREEKKNEKKQKKDFKAPEQVKKTDENDPTYETLNGMGNELFAEDAKTQQSVQQSAAQKA